MVQEGIVSKGQLGTRRIVLPGTSFVGGKSNFSEGSLGLT